MPLALEHHQHDLKSDSGRDFAIDKAAGLLHGEMKKVLSRRQYEIYEMLFVKNMSDEEIAIKMGYKTSESGRKAGYKQIKNMKKQFKTKAEKILRWTPIYTISESIKTTIDWYKNVHIKKILPEKVTKDQILEYFKNVKKS